MPCSVSEISKRLLVGGFITYTLSSYSSAVILTLQLSFKVIDLVLKSFADSQPNLELSIRIKSPADIFTPEGLISKVTERLKRDWSNFCFTIILALK